MDFSEYDPLMFPVTDDDYDDEKRRKDNNLFDIDPDEGFDGEEDEYE